jgi:hypothetical protein
VLSSSNNNYLCNPYSTKVVEYLWSNPRIFTLAQWRTTTGLDAASVGSYDTWTLPSDNSFLVVNNTASAATYNYTNVKNLNNQSVNGITLQPFTSQVLINLPALPIELLNFSGKNTPDGNALKWQTANEINNKGFNVERLDPQTQQWQTLGFVNSRDAMHRVSNYDFVDKTPLDISYYRLRQIDKDSKSNLSNIINIAMEGKTSLLIYPNPVSHNLTVLYNGDATDFEVFNILGQSVLQGNINQSVDVSRLAVGTYIVKVGAEQVKFVKQ